MEPSGDALTRQLQRMTEAQARVQDEATKEAEPTAGKAPEPPPPPQPQLEPEPQP